MEKIGGWIFLGVTLLISDPMPPLIKKNCISCHAQQQIPSELIYRRYLLRYSTHDRIKKRLFYYLRSPDKAHSIMPKQFFLKFPMKQPLDLNESQLLESIDQYLDYFDIKKRWVLP